MWQEVLLLNRHGNKLELHTTLTARFNFENTNLKPTIADENFHVLVADNNVRKHCPLYRTPNSLLHKLKIR